jgi:peptidoglycan/LPS O-acetylase OafA/YrhL
VNKVNKVNQVKTLKPSHRADIDGLRGVAVLSVIFYHMGFSFFEGGFVGVDVFFVVSGYLITRSIIFDLKHGQFSILDFYNRRARRILPSLLVVVFLSTISGYFFMPPPSYKDLTESSLAALLFVSNFHFQAEVDYFDTIAELKPLLHTWSLAIEEQFYFVIPILVLLSKSIRAFTILIAIVFVAALVSFLISSEDQSKLFFFPQYRVWELAVGSLCSLIEYRHSNILGRLKSLKIAYFGMLGVLSSVLLFNSTEWPSSLAIIPVFGTFLILFNAGKNMFLGNGLLAFFGKRSYSFYLVHFPIISFSYYIVGTSLSASQTLLVVCLIFVFGVFIFQTVEKKFVLTTTSVTSISSAVTNRKLFLFVGFFSALTFSISMAAISTEGYMFNPNKEYLQKVVSTTKRQHILCSEPSVLECVNKSENAKVVLIGDSNSYHFAVGAEKYSPNNKIISLTKGGCMPLAKFTRLEQSKSYNDKCLNFNKDVDEIVSSDFSKERVAVVSAAWMLYLYGDDLYKNEPMSKLANFGDIVLGDVDFKPIQKDQKRLAMREYLVNLVQKLSERFQYVVILGPIPPQPYAVQSEASLQFYGHNGTSSALFYSYATPILDIFEEMENLRISNVEVIYPHIQLCDTFIKDRCVGYVDGEHFYGDESHVSAVGQYVAYKGLFDYLSNL